ncbi:MAG: hypothetical protein RLZZ58_1135 [Pseudomonadota bacterium]
MRTPFVAILAAPLLVSGCVGTVKSIVTAPVNAVGQAADWATTSQDEKDRARGRSLRERDERLGKLSRQRDKAAAKCDDGDREQCGRAEVLDQEIEAEMGAPM